MSFVCGHSPGTLRALGRLVTIDQLTAEYLAQEAARPYIDGNQYDPSQWGGIAQINLSLQVQRDRNRALYDDAVAHGLDPTTHLYEAPEYPPYVMSAIPPADAQKYLPGNVAEPSAAEQPRSVEAIITEFQTAAAHAPITDPALLALVTPAPASQTQSAAPAQTITMTPAQPSTWISPAGSATAPTGNAATTNPQPSQATDQTVLNTPISTVAQAYDQAKSAVQSAVNKAAEFPWYIWAGLAVLVLSMQLDKNRSQQQ